MGEVRDTSRARGMLLEGGYLGWTLLTTAGRVFLTSHPQLARYEAHPRQSRQPGVLAIAGRHMSTSLCQRDLYMCTTCLQNSIQT